MSQVKNTLRRMGIRKPWRRRDQGAEFQVTAAQAIAAGANDCELADLFYSHEGRLVWKWTHYFSIYSRHFEPFRSGFPVGDGDRRPLRFLELGVFHGGSLQLWRKYFGPDASIWGIDIDSRCAAVADPDVQVRIGSQTDADFLHSVVGEMGGVDIVLDDASHVAEHQRTSFEVLFPLLSDGGLYIVEDLHTAYWKDWGGGYRRPGTFIEVAKDLVDGMHAWYFRRRPPAIAADAKTTVGSVAFYDNIVVIEKRRHEKPTAVKVGQPSF